MVDAETLKNIGIATVGQRLAILKAVYMIKLAHNVPLEADDYVPPCPSTHLPFLIRLPHNIH